MSESETVQTVMNGRLPNGKFGSGNQFSAGRSSRAAELRRAFVEAVTPEDIEAIAATLVRLAKDGDVQCAKLVLDRLGKPGTDEDDLTEGRNHVLEFLARQPESAAECIDRIRRERTDEHAES